MKKLNEISGKVIHAAFNVHSRLGPGLLEKTYQTCLAYELRKVGLFVEEEVPVPLHYDDVRLECGFRLDLRVERCLIVELKAVEQIAPVHVAQLMTYLKLTNIRLGLLLNFYEVKLKDGIKRIIM